MKRFGGQLLTFAAPLLILLAIAAFFHRKENDRVQSIPALFTGIGLTCSNYFGRSIHRNTLIQEIRKKQKKII